MAHVSPYEQVSDPRRRNEREDDHADEPAARPRWALTIFGSVAVVTLLAMVAVLFSPLYPDPGVGVGLAFVIALGFIVLYVAARRAAMIRGRS